MFNIGCLMWFLESAQLKLIVDLMSHNLLYLLSSNRGILPC